LNALTYLLTYLFNQLNPEETSTKMVIQSSKLLTDPAARYYADMTTWPTRSLARHSPNFFESFSTTAWYCSATAENTSLRQVTPPIHSWRHITLLYIIIQLGSTDTALPPLWTHTLHYNTVTA